MNPFCWKWLPAGLRTTGKLLSLGHTEVESWPWEGNLYSWLDPVWPPSLENQRKKFVQTWWLTSRSLLTIRKRKRLSDFVVCQLPVISKLVQYSLSAVGQTTWVMLSQQAFNGLKAALFSHYNFKSWVPLLLQSSLANKCHQPLAMFIVKQGYDLRKLWPRFS